jgi:hypothetical protein
MSKKPTKLSNSREFSIDLYVEELLGKLVAGTLSPEEEADFNYLVAQRSRMMRFSRSERRRAA